MAEVDFEAKSEALIKRHAVACLKRDRLANSHAKAAAKAKFLYDRIARLFVKGFIARTGICVKALVEYHAAIYHVQSIEWDGSQIAVWIKAKDSEELAKVTDTTQLKRFEKPKAAEVLDNVAV